MNYTVAPIELADIGTPCSWSIYMDMFDVWRQCLSFNSRLLDDLFSEYLFEKFQSYRDKVHCSDLSFLQFDENYTVIQQHQMSVHINYLKIDNLTNYTYEEYVSANPNITIFTVQKHAEFAWDYNQLHCFLGDTSDNKGYLEVKERLCRSKNWKRRYTDWSKCLRENNNLLDLCYNKYLKVVYFIENDDMFQQILDSEFFNIFCKNPNVTWEFLKTRVAYNCNVSLKKRIITLINPNVRWHDVLEFCRANNLFLKSDFWAKPEFTYLYANYTHLIDYRKLQEQDLNCDIISAIMQKPDVPEEVVMSLDRQYYAQFSNLYSWIKCEKGCLCSTKSKFRDKNFVMPIFLNLNVQKKLKNTNSSVLYLDYRNGYFIKDVKKNFNFLKNSEHIYLDAELFQNPMCIEKLAFLHEVLTPAAIKIQRWYLKHFYRPNSRYVATTLRNRFNNALQKTINTINHV
ncbi:unknown [Spodoptera litura nucleopolyhedrovirus]|uniref:Uncharacterized protein n=1 Tax=Spodoptera litura multicapsid nucleopolyhedrovirus TaxID=46242 RepID=Q91BA8_NPVST|nr:hypothetical protein [Spodoptera litura nucleopolyhedrovirus]AAL01808.1 unknown [Spodoptera litura nucleopolyhedrovirus]QHN73973.1 hypothetical protein [Spodoptera litura nucleopolyhedrovirus]